jgi:uncharacterized glyoxalase superfamily protein PhnB
VLFNRSAAPGPVVPTLVYADVGRAIDWLCQTFGFSERFRYGPPGNPGGAFLSVGAGSVALTQARTGQSSEWGDGAVLRPPRPDEVTHTVAVHVADVDAHYAHTLRSGARILHPPETYPFGERQYTAEDLAGHRWTFTQSVADVAPEAWGGQTASPTPEA